MSSHPKLCGPGRITQDWSKVKDQTKYGSQRPQLKTEEGGMWPCSVQGPPLEPGLDGGPNGEHLVVGSATETWPGTTGRSRVVPNSPSSHHQVSCHTGGGDIGEPQRPTPGQHRLALGLWNITKLKGKDLDLAREIERYQLHVVWLNCGSIKRKF